MENKCIWIHNMIHKFNHKINLSVTINSVFTFVVKNYNVQLLKVSFNADNLRIFVNKYVIKRVCYLYLMLQIKYFKLRY